MLRSALRRVAASAVPLARVPLSPSRLPLLPSRLPLPLLPARGMCWSRTDDADLDPVVPPSDRVLVAKPRGEKEFGNSRCQKLRDSGRTPCNVVGDRLPYVSLSVDTNELILFLKRTHCQRELMTLRVEGGLSPFEGEETLVLPQELQYEDKKHFNPTHVTFRRWPRDPERNPIKLAVPLIFMHAESIPAVKAGSYVHEMFETGQGLRCWVRQKEHIPRFIIADMRRAVNGDLRYGDLDVPPGVTPRKYAATAPHCPMRCPAGAKQHALMVWGGHTVCAQV